jgi:2-oxoglutarate ferredoxin oxidoreductase subunit alpha
MEPVVPAYRTPPRIAADWAASGTSGRRRHVVKSLHLEPAELEAHNNHLQAKFRAIEAAEVRWAGEQLDDAEIAIVAYGTAARVARTVIRRAREGGMRAGLVRPISLWPFPSRPIAALTQRVRGILVVELSAGQMLEDVRLAVDGRTPVAFHGRTGGMVPTPDEVLVALRRLWSVTTERKDRS